MGNDWPIYAPVILLVVTWIAVLYIAGSRKTRAIRAKANAARASLEVPPRVTVFGEASALAEVREPLSAAIHSCLVEFFGKADDEINRPYQLYVPLPAGNIKAPRSNGYLMIDVEVCEGLIPPS